MQTFKIIALYPRQRAVCARFFLRHGRRTVTTAFLSGLFGPHDLNLKRVMEDAPSLQPAHKTTLADIKARIKGEYDAAGRGHAPVPRLVRGREPRTRGGGPRKGCGTERSLCINEDATIANAKTITGARNEPRTGTTQTRATRKRDRCTAPRPALLRSTRAARYQPTRRCRPSTR